MYNKNLLFYFLNEIFNRKAIFMVVLTYRKIDYRLKFVILKSLRTYKMRTGSVETRETFQGETGFFLPIYE